jgi:hypothetical protein
MKTDYKDGWLTIREEENLSNEPIKQITWWPIAKDTKTSLEAMDLLDKEATYTSGGTYSIRIAAYQYRRAILTDAGSTRPLAMEHQPIEAPKVRKGIEVRYRNGQWQKYLKSQGWVTA